MNDYLVFSVIVFAASSLIVVATYGRYRGGVVTRLVGASLGLSVVVASVSFFLGKEGLAFSHVALAVVIGTAALVASAWFLYRTVVEPMLGIASIAERIAAGDLTALPEETTREDEVGRVLRAFRKVTDAHRGLIVRLKEDSRSLQRSAAEMAEIAVQTSAFAAEQEIVVKELNASMVEIAHVSSAAAERAHEVRTSSQSAAERGQSGLQAIGRVETEMAAIRAQVNRLAEGVRGLRDDGARIAEIAALVEDLAAQSDLLAVNATLEAARAGMQGRAFGVVADEVRRLAERSKGAASEIQAIVREHRRGTEAAVRAAEEGVSHTESGRQAMGALGRVIDELAGALAQGAERSRQIAVGAEEQAHGVTEVVDVLQALSEGGRQTSEGAESMERLVDEWNELARSYAEVASQYRL